MWDERSFSSTSYDARSWFGRARREVVRRASLIAKWINGASWLLQRARAAGSSRLALVIVGKSIITLEDV